MNIFSPAAGGGASLRAPDAAVSVSVRRLYQSYAGKSALAEVDLDVPAGTVLALLGPSGCGKSTLLKALAGLLRPDSGCIAFGERVIVDDRVCLPPEDRDLGMVFQDYALWPHMSVAANVAFPLEMRRVPKADRHHLVTEALALVGLAAYGNRRPAELSGGQQQRVALARAVVARPGVLLFDEPLSNLDRALRESLCQELAGLLRRLSITAVYVTHDPAEAHALAHRIAYMADGRIQQIVPVPSSQD